MKDRGFALSMNLERGKLREEREREQKETDGEGRREREGINQGYKW